MDDVESTTRKYLEQGTMMQLATESNGQPWCCSLYFVADDLNLYWISLPTRRHSEEIEKHSKVAAAIPIQHVPGESVVGVQVEGDAALVTDPDEIEKAIRLYGERFSRGSQFIDDFIAGKNSHVLYRLSCRSLVLFDEVTFPQDTRRVWTP